MNYLFETVGIAPIVEILGNVIIAEFKLSQLSEYWSAETEIVFNHGKILLLN